MPENQDPIERRHQELMDRLGSINFGLWMTLTGIMMILFTLWNKWK